VPHPRLAERAFVLEPLAGLAPELRVPGTGQTATELLCSLRAEDATREPT
jgi:2-amino-4-hydroxy-6-hydroxymethyldihydropteridine diphosphokinase